MNRLRVLVAEDDPLTRLDLCRILEHAGYRVAGETSNGRDAVVRALELRPDLVLMDVGLPRLNGVEAARAIRERSAVPIVLLTGYGYGEVVADAIEAGVTAFVSKPFREAELLDALRAALRPRPNDAGLAYLEIAGTEAERPA